MQIAFDDLIGKIIQVYLNDLTPETDKIILIFLEKISYIAESLECP